MTPTLPLPPHLAKKFDELRGTHPQMAWKKDQCVAVFACCGLGGRKFYEKLKASGTLIPVRHFTSAKHARYDREHVLDLIRDALAPAPPAAAPDSGQNQRNYP